MCSKVHKPYMHYLPSSSDKTQRILSVSEEARVLEGNGSQSEGSFESILPIQLLGKETPLSVRCGAHFFFFYL